MFSKMKKLLFVALALITVLPTATVAMQQEQSRTGLPIDLRLLIDIRLLKDMPRDSEIASAETEEIPKILRELAIDARHMKKYRKVYKRKRPSRILETHIPRIYRSVDAIEKRINDSAPGDSFRTHWLVRSILGATTGAALGGLVSWLTGENFTLRCAIHGGLVGASRGRSTAVQTIAHATGMACASRIDQETPGLALLATALGTSALTSGALRVTELDVSRRNTLRGQCASIRQILAQ